jgi:hypothetical protein
MSKAKRPPLTLKPVSEAEFTRQVIQLAQACGWMVAHFRAARTKHGWATPVSGDGKGWPDLTLIRDSEIFWAELKVPPNKTTPEQDQWLAALRKAGLRAVVWTPAQWGEIEQTLKGDKHAKLSRD